MSPITLSSILTIAADDSLASMAMEDEILMTNLQTERYFGLDRTGRRIWQLLERPLAVKEVCHRLLDEYDIDRTTCEEQVLAFLTQLRAEGLIVVVG
ncbi:MAG TPA: PqqD family peptide modification chaperone [Candidatus Xenobia bacterium]